MAGEAVEAPQPVLDRSCGTCTLCCKVLAVAELDKPKHKWCTYCHIGRGCGIWGSHPQECRQFMCGYLMWEIVPEFWRPDKSGIVIANEANGYRIAFHVDEGQQNIWRKDPYYSGIKALAVEAAPADTQVVVTIGSRIIAILPDADIDMGILKQGERILTGRRADGSWGAEKVSKDDPRLAGAAGAG
jgi:hypothetical protein